MRLVCCDGRWNCLLIWGGFGGWLGSLDQQLRMVSSFAFRSFALVPIISTSVRYLLFQYMLDFFKVSQCRCQVGRIPDREKDEDENQQISRSVFPLSGFKCKITLSLWVVGKSSKTIWLQYNFQDENILLVHTKTFVLSINTFKKHTSLVAEIFK